MPHSTNSHQWAEARRKAAQSSRRPERQRLPTLLKNLLRLVAIGLALLCLAASRLHACGPGFPNNLLNLGDDAVLLAPVAEFRRELDRIKLMPARSKAMPVANDRDRLTQTLDAEENDLETALKKRKVSAEERKQICAAHRAAREKLQSYVDAVESWERDRSCQRDVGPKPRFPKVEFTAGLPTEFQDYFDGVIAWHNPALADRSMAREPWERLLALPEAERKFKSTWAAFMLGKSWEGKDVERAAGYFRQVRELAAHGFADSSGLAAASFGLEARIYYRGGDYPYAIALYLKQLATGDPTAVLSLQKVASEALTKAKPDTLRALATNRLARQVITAKLISTCDLRWTSERKNINQTNDITVRWLRAVEAAQVQNVESAERLALAAYQGGAFDLAQRWVNRSTNSPTAQWLQAKLFLRAGKIEPAVVLLAKVARRLPVTADGGAQGKEDFADDLVMKFDENSYVGVPARRQILGELGVLRVSRGEFTQALDALLRAGFWADAAYVAERVLTTDELKDYVDRNWPAVSLHPSGGDAGPRVLDDSQVVPTAATEGVNTQESSPARIGSDIRYLLARRLTREIHGDVAREYYPAEWRSSFDALAGALLVGWDESQPAEQRADSLFTAACIARTKGMELLGTELQPDWHLRDGDFEGSLTWQNRAANHRHARINFATADETSRAAAHRADPETRFHYRYQAAFLGWEAARLMPDNTNTTARVLWTSGGWLKGRDPETADIFYKALVRRCRGTALGAEADRIRWFPNLDDDGNVIPRNPPAVKVTPAKMDDEILPPQSLADSQTKDEHGYEYTLHSGDTLAAVLKAYNEMNVNVTLEHILDANPGLNAAHLKVGQKIFIPATKVAEEGEQAAGEK